MKSIFVILGAGGFAREVFWHIKETHDNADFLFVDDHSDLTEISFKGLSKSFEVIKNWDFDKYKNDIAGFIIGVGNPVLKEQLVEKAIKAGISPHPTIIHKNAIVQGTDCEFGVGGIVTPGCVITTNTKIGDYVILNLNCTVGHDAVISDYVTANPGCHISGNTTLGKGVTLGTGTALREKISIDDYVVTGAQSCVVKHINKKSIIVTGVPAKELIKK